MGELNIGLLRASAPLMMVLDREGRILLWNQACSELTGYTLEEAQGKYAWDFLAAPEDAEHARAAYREILVGEVPPRVEGYLVTKSGERRWIGWSHDLTRRPDGTVEFSSAIGVDRTDAKQAEEALRISEARFAGIVSIATEAIISVDEQQRIVIYNEGAERIFGWTRDEILGRPLDTLIPERFREIHWKHIHGFAQEAAQARKMGERRPAIFGLRKNGEEFPADAAISKLHVDGVRLYTVVLRDITAQKIVERDQRFLSEVGATLATSLDYGETLTRIAELSVRFLADCCIMDLIQEDGTIRRWKVIHADPGMANLAERLEHLPLDITKPHLASAVLATKRTTVVSDVTSGHLESIAQGDEEHLQLLRELGPTSYVGLPLLAHDRLLGAMVLVRTDSTRQYGENDVRLGEELAYRAAHSIDSARLYRVSQQAIRTRDEVLGIVAHDLRNPIHAAMLAAHTLLHRERDEERQASAPNLAEIIARSLERANRLIQDLLDVSRMEAGRLTVEHAPLSSEGLVMEAMEAFAPMASAASLEMEADIRPPLPPVLADSERFAQVFSNLVGNALKFTPAGGRIQIGAEQRAGEACFWVRDTGPGISKLKLQHLFERFWQAGRADRRGAGLGLSIAKGIVDAHGGRIWVESTPGVGSTFYFTVPVAAVPEDRPVEPTPVSDPP
jgi:PAS domain S-box-containing protein